MIVLLIDLNTLRNLEFDHMAALKMDCDTVMVMSLSFNMVEPLEKTGNWQDRANHNVQKFYETTMDRKENKHNTVIVSYSSLQVKMLATANLAQ